LPVGKNGEILSAFQMEKIIGNAIHRSIIGDITSTEALEMVEKELNELMI
jgi:hypothetical protein